MLCWPGMGPEQSAEPILSVDKLMKLHEIAQPSACKSLPSSYLRSRGARFSDGAPGSVVPGGLRERRHGAHADVGNGSLAVSGMCPGPIAQSSGDP